MLADKMVEYVETVISRFNSDYVSISAAVKVGEARMVLHIFLYYYNDEEKKIEEWRGQVEALAEVNKPKGQHSVRKRITFVKEVSGFIIYRALMQAARHAYGAVQGE